MTASPDAEWTLTPAALDLLRCDRRRIARDADADRQLDAHHDLCPQCTVRRHHTPVCPTCGALRITVHLTGLALALAVSA